ncbi:hypothetical protein H2198_008194 [Neophaeococcomyces mojaviensis]|uniref:Uncharacterized protein n=1 Tax=Neophaeococcomyces mojaviensis TaxID=3383035 RepID=A0ACC2ZY01_9EURO|nr:hypothetical protein H2198_008194 [Knufia sp. JES_112]
MSCAGDKTRKSWLARFIYGHIELHDFWTRMFNFQRQIAIHRLPAPRETEAERIQREDCLQALRVVFIVKKHQTLEKVLKTKAERALRSTNSKENVDWQRTNGHVSSEEYGTYLDELERDILELKEWDDIQHIDDVPEEKKLYGEKYEHDGDGHFAFWEAKFTTKGVPESFYNGFLHIIHLDSCLQHPATCTYLVWLFCHICHFSWIHSAWRIIDNFGFNEKGLQTASGHTAQMPKTLDKPYIAVRDRIKRHPTIPSYDEGYVRESEISKETIRSNKRVHFDHVESSTPPKRFRGS